jgi:hypothetical protein
MLRAMKSRNAPRAGRVLTPALLRKVVGGETAPVPNIPPIPGMCPGTIVLPTTEPKKP